MSIHGLGGSLSANALAELLQKMSVPGATEDGASAQSGSMLEQILNSNATSDTGAKSLIEILDEDDNQDNDGLDQLFSLEMQSIQLETYTALGKLQAQKTGESTVNTNG